MSYVSYISTLSIPACAPQINGSFLEEQIPGFRTTSVGNRQGWKASLTEIDSDLLDGSIYRRRKDNNKEVTVNFNITTDSKATFNSSWNRLRWLLSKESSKFIFNDEPKLYMIGNVTDISDDPVDGSGSGVISANGSYTIHFSDPYKYAVTETEVSLSNGVFTTVNAGMYPSKPRFEITCTSSLAGITLIDANSNIILIGDMSLASGAAQSKFQKNDVIKINTADCSIYVGTTPVPGYGDIANQWEEFKIQNGSNSIKCTWTAGSTATAKMFYREVYR